MSLTNRTHPPDLHAKMMEEHPNAGTIAGLREVAAFLEAHPELPPAWYASVAFHAGAPAGNDWGPRALLSHLADTLDDPQERVSMSDVVIEGTFSGGVRVTARAGITAVSDAPPVPEYEPIIAAKPEPPVGAEDFGAVDEAA